ncbi:MAG: DUF6036 family nucleotidyltransferase, partial [Thermoanaerobaculia bacterium]
VHVYFTGGATAVLEGWRESTIDIDLKLIPDADEILRAIPRLKEELGINVELAAPDQFIPELPGWRERSRFIRQIRRLSFFHYDFYAQSLAKLERGHDKDLRDVSHIVSAGRVDLDELLRFFVEIEPMLYRYPAIDPATFRRAVEEFVESAAKAE